MRIAQQSIYETYQFQLGKITEEMTDISEDVTTGLRINELKDDPVGLTQVLSLKSNLSELAQIGKNISTGRTWLRAGETALSNVQDIITDAKGIAITMKNTTSDSSMRQVAAEQIKGYLLQIESLSNTTVLGQYIFAGTKTDTQPFALDDPDNPTTAAYSGNNDAFRIKTGKDSTVEVGHEGGAIFSTLFQTLIDLKGYLEANDTSGIGTCIDSLTTDFDRINSKVSEIGAREVRLDTREKIITDLNLRYAENRAEIEEVDIVEAISNLQATQLAYQAALASSSKIMTLSLVDYL